jgi:hypothetical protein
VSAVDEHGKYQVDELTFGDIWYFPKGQAHTVQGLDDENEYLLAFDDGDFDKVGFVLLPGLTPLFTTHTKILAAQRST